MPFTDLRGERGLGLQPQQCGVTQSNDYRCGAACAVYIYALLRPEDFHLNPQVPNTDKKLDYFEGDIQDEAMSHTHTAGAAEKLGSTPSKIARYVMSKRGKKWLDVTRLNEDEATTQTKARARARRTTHFWLANFRRQNAWHHRKCTHVPSVLGENSVILRMLLPRRASLSAHFVVETRFKGETQIMDPSGGTIQTQSYQDYLDLNDSEPTLLDLVFTTS